MTTNPVGARRAGRLDPWAFAAAAGVLVPLVKLWGAPLGEPVADDFDFLHHALFGPRSFLDGGGALIYWRPLARQIYFAVAGPVMLSHPLATALFHAALLAASAVLLQRALAPVWGGMRAAVAASFPVIAESARTLILWPTAIQDLGALFFVSLAFHETTRRRLPGTLLAILAALLCKELAVVPALLLPFVPGAPPGDRRRWGIGIGALVATWGAAYALVLRSGHVMVQSQLEGMRPPLDVRLLWALGSSLGDAFNLGGMPGAFVAVFALALVVVGLVVRARSRSTGWLLWGAIWFVLCSVTLGETYPVWGAFRSTLGTTGLGIACVAAVGGQRLVLGAVVLLRLVMLLLAAGVPGTIAAAPPGDGSGFDVVTLSRLQRVSRQTRAAFPARPSNAHWSQGSRFIWLQRPLMSERAFAHSKALQVWLRDTTLAWGSLQDAADDSALRIAGGLEYNIAARPQISWIASEDLHRLATGIRMMRAEQYHEALAELPPADQWPGGAVLRSIVWGKRALSYLALEDDENARREAEASLQLWDSGDGHYVRAVLLMNDGKRREAIAELDSLLSLYPEDPSARMLRDTLQAETER